MYDSLRIAREWRRTSVKMLVSVNQGSQAFHLVADGFIDAVHAAKGIEDQSLLLCPPHLKPLHPLSPYQL